jgi:hypothetical protein
MIMIFDKIFRRRKSAFWVCLGLALVFTLSAVPANLSYAQGRYMSEEWKVPKFYPRGFDGYGKIDTIEEDGVIISDTAWKFSPGIQFATPGDRNAGIDDFSPGDTVAYLLNQDREITSLWYIEFHKR